MSLFKSISDAIWDFRVGGLPFMGIWTFDWNFDIPVGILERSELNCITFQIVFVHNLGYSGSRNGYLGTFGDSAGNFDIPVGLLEGMRGDCVTFQIVFVRNPGVRGGGVAIWGHLEIPREILIFRWTLGKNEG